MSFVSRQAAHCDKCSHEWLTDITPSHCARCKSRQWNNLGNMQTACVSPVYEPPAFVDTMRPPPHHDAMERLAITSRIIEDIAVGDMSMTHKSGNRTATGITRMIESKRAAHDPKTCRIYRCGMCAAKP